MSEAVSVPKRPAAVTAAAIFAGLCFVGLLAYAFVLVPCLAEAYGSWYVPLWFGSVFALGAVAVGYWRMRRWGLYVYAAYFAVGTAVGVAVGIPFTVAGVLVPLAVIGVGAAYWERMR